MSKRKPKRLIRDLRQPQLFSNEDLGLPPDEFEIRGTKLVTNKFGKKVRIAIMGRTKESYEALARNVWGDRYDYTDSIYTNERSPITIYCPKHDYHFTVAMAQNHILRAKGTFQPTGCPVCQYEEQYGEEYGTDWDLFLKLSPNSNRVGKIVYEPSAKKKKQKESERAIREQERLHLLEIQKDYMRQWHAKTMKEARFNERVYQMYGDDLDTSVAGYINDHKPVLLICRHHGAFRIRPRLLLRGEKGNPPHGCWKCSGLTDPNENSRMTAKRFYDIMRHLYQILDFTKYRRRKIKPGTKITAVCMKHGEITHDAQWWLDGKGCEYCNGKFYPPEWKENAVKRHGNKYEYVGEPPRTMSDYIHYICPEHGLQEQRYDIHVGQGCGCPKCANYPNKKTPLERCNEWIEKSDKKYRGAFDYSEAPADYINNDSKVWLTHKPCGTRFQITPDTHLRGVNGGCPLCNAIYLESEGERAVRLWLEDHGIDHRTQEVVPNEDPTLPLEYLKVDFWLDDVHSFPMVIEYNGPQHYEYSAYFHEGRRRDFVVQVHRDRYLRKYCSDHHIQLLEIPYTYFDQIGDILQKAMNGEMPDLVQPKIVMPSSDKA